MKKATHQTQNFFLKILVVLPFLLPLPALAQSTPTGHFLFVSQGGIASSDTLCATTGFTHCLQGDVVDLGTGYSGVVTSATIGFQGTFTSSHEILTVGVIDNTASLVVCAWDSENGGLPDGNYIGGFVQLTHPGGGNEYSAPPGGWPVLCQLDPTHDYSVGMWWYENSGTSFLQFSYTGADATTSLLLHPTWSSTWHTAPSLPFSSGGLGGFSLVGDNFQIIPTASSTGLLLSGAQEFCNAQFGTSSAGIFGIGTDIANGLCQTAGYLFIPTPASLAQYTEFPTVLQSKIPFSYGYDIAAIFQGLTGSTSENFPVYSMPLAELDFSSSTSLGPILPTNLEFLSSSTINHFLPVGMHDLLYNLMIFAIWLDVAFVLYRKVVPQKAKI